MIARLLYPVADPTFNYKFCKGYYFRSDGTKLNGRVTRLMVTPLIRSLFTDWPRYSTGGTTASSVPVLAAHSSSIPAEPDLSEPK